MHKISVIDSHTGGEPTRVVVAGGPELGGGPLVERRERFRREFDHLRSAVVCEPRGSEVVAVVLLACSARAPAAPARERVSFDADWRFHQGDPAGLDDQLDYAKIKPWLLASADAFTHTPTPKPDTALETTAAFARPDFDDADWRKLDLPHDWGIEGPFKQELPGSTGKLPWAGVAWYRKTFELPASDAGRRVSLEFGGAMSYATVWCNGQFAGGWPYGYASWQVDLTPFLKPGARNVVAVCDTPDGDFQYLRSFRPLDKESRDIGQFIDDDGSAYLIFESRPTHGFFIAKLSDDYLDVKEETAFINAPLEGGALVHYNGLYYAVGSHLTGWDPNDNLYATAPRLSGPWSEFKDIAPRGKRTYDSQSTMLLRVDGSKSTCVLFMGDMWNKHDLPDSRYLWMPVEIGDGKLRLPEPREWTLEARTGEVATEPPFSLPAAPARP